MKLNWSAARRAFLWRVLAVMLIVSAYCMGFRHGADESLIVYSSSGCSKADLQALDYPVRELVMYLLNGTDAAEANF